MKKWFSENIVFAVTVLIAIAVIVFGAVYSAVCCFCNCIHRLFGMDGIGKIWPYQIR